MRRALSAGAVIALIVLSFAPLFSVQANAADRAAESAQAQDDQKIQLPLGVGDPREINLAPSTGNISDRLSIIAAPGRRHVEPHLALSYSSQGGMSDVGMGWQLDIGYVEKWRGDGTPTVGVADAFFFSLSGLAGELRNTGGGLYRARFENAYREFRQVGGGWEMRDGQGVTTRFGSTPDSRTLDANGNGLLWMLDKVTDASGNTISYSYDRSGHILSIREIRYAGFALTGDLGPNSITFAYEDRPDVTRSYRDGVQEDRTKRLSSITVKAGARMARRYDLGYTEVPSNGQSLLSTIDLVGADGAATIRLRTYEYTSRDPLTWATPATPSGLPDLTDSDGKDTGARLMDVDGDGYADAIAGNGTEVRVGNGHGTFTKNDSWSASLAAAGVNFAIASGDTQGADTGVRLIDVNGDAMPDLLIAQEERREVWLNTRSGWAKNVAWSASLNTIGGSAEALSSSTLGDLHGYSQPDCASPHGTNPCVTGVHEHQPACDPLHPHPKRDADGNIVKDANGNEVPIPCYPAHLTLAGACSPGATATCTRVNEKLALAASNGDSKGVQLADVNGDGRPDIVWSLHRGSVSFEAVGDVPVDVRGVFLNTGSGWIHDATLTAGLWQVGDFVRDSEIEGYDLADVNGDGFADVVRSFGGAPREVRLGTGRGWVLDAGRGASLDANGIASVDGDRKGNGLNPMDINDDGLIDYLRAKDGPAMVYVNDGSTWSSRGDLAANLTSRGVMFADGEGKSTGWSFTDIDGDGIPDLLRAKGGTAQSLVLSSPATGAPTVRPGLPERATTALGEVVTLDWTVSNRFDNRRADGTQGLPNPIPVVATSTTRDGRGTEAAWSPAYSGGLYTDRQSRGFKKVTVHRTQGVDVVTTFHQEEGLAGLAITQEGVDATGVRTRRTSSHAILPAGPGITQFTLTGTLDETFDPAGSRGVRTTYEVDDRLAYTKVTRDPDVTRAGDATVTTYEWVRNVATGLWAVPSRNATTAEDGRLLSETRTAYDGLSSGATKGLPSASSQLVSGTTYVTKSLAYDQFGNVARINDRNGNPTTFEYDSTGTFRVAATDPEGRTSRSTYDSLFGALLSDTDPGGNVTRIAYDVFGRVLSVSGADESVASKTYQYSALGTPGAQWMRESDRQSVANPVMFSTTKSFDAWARVYRVERTASAGRTIVTQTEYDDADNVVSTTQPYFAAGGVAVSPVRWSTVERDPLRRPIKVTEVDGKFTTERYAGATIEVTDREGNVSRYLSDADGNVTRVAQMLGAREIVTTYRYDAIGRLVEVKDALGETTTVEYDALGRRSRIVDPNAGAFRYTYDGEGRVISTLGPDGRTTSYAYNRAGDLLKKTLPDATAITYAYATTGKDTGLLTRVVDSAGTLDLRYDNRGNVIQRSRTILATWRGDDGDEGRGPWVRRANGRLYVTSYSYDMLGRPTRVTYPDGFAAVYEYDDGGNLAAVKDGKGQIIETGTTYSPTGQLLAMTLGNGDKTTYAYDDLLRMTSIGTTSAAGALLQKSNYSYSANGNVLAITDLAFNLNQAFSYDGLGRLVNAKGGYGDETYRYDDLGNLLQKGSLYFGLDPAHPQRVLCAIDSASTERGGDDKGDKKTADAATRRCLEQLAPTVPLSSSSKKDQRGDTGVRSFTLEYDARGNVVRKGDQRFGYDAQNQLTAVFRGNGNSVAEANVYDAGGDRVLQRTDGKTTVFIDGIYEDDGREISHHVRTDAMILATIVSRRGEDGAAGTTARTDVAGPMLPFGPIAMVAAAPLLALVIRQRRRWATDLDELAGRLRRRPVFAAVVLGLALAVLNSGAGIGVAATSPSDLGSRSAQDDRSGETRLYYHSDHLGSVNVVTNERGAIVVRRQYRPYGDAFAWTAAKQNDNRPRVDFAFGGARLEAAAGIYNFGARFYDPQLGRFLSVDTVVADPQNPATLNRYAYAGGNPIRYSDPTGHAWWDFVIAALIVIVAIVLTVVTFGAMSGLLVAAIAIAGGIIAGAIAASKGDSPLSESFWKQVTAGIVIGAVIGAGLVALPTMLAGGAALGPTIGASILFGAATGAAETTISHYAAGGNTESLFGSSLWISIGIGAAIGAASGGIGRGLKGIGNALSRTFPRAFGWAASAVAGAGGAAAKVTATGILKVSLSAVRMAWAGGASAVSHRPITFREDPALPFTALGAQLAIGYSATRDYTVTGYNYAASGVASMALGLEGLIAPR